MADAQESDGLLMQVGRTYRCERTVTEDDVASFASLSGDTNPLHLDEDFAARTPFGRRVVHGALIMSFVSAALTRLTGPGYVYLGQESRFRSPVFVGDTVVVSVRITRRRHDKPILTVETIVAKDDGTRVLDGSAALMALRVQSL